MGSLEEMENPVKKSTHATNQATVAVHKHVQRKEMKHFVRVLHLSTSSIKMERHVTQFIHAIKERTGAVVKSVTKMVPKPRVPVMWTTNSELMEKLAKKYILAPVRTTVNVNR